MIRWLRFNVVGIAGAVVQLAALWLLARVAGIEYVVATALAVEIAVMHNFAWHEAWTWHGMPREGRRRRLARFHVANGILSIAANTLFTWLFVHTFGMPLLISNLGAMCVTALLNFALAAAWVFRPSPANGSGSRASAARRRRTAHTAAS